MVPSELARRDPPIWWIRTGVALIVGCFLLLGGLALMATRHHATMPDLVVYFQPGATPAQLDDVKRGLETMADVRSVRYLNQAQVLAERIASKKRTGIDDLIVDSVADWPSAYQVFPRSPANRHDIGGWLLGRPGTLSVVYPGE